ncbi:MAG TPA: LuxR C-terminal-related transcriptional regulator [Solirubrobacterales bacterium]|nr:LuxR C-terminal-related transcriptional regulator [Solirubrobacterales bacterium]
MTSEAAAKQPHLHSLGEESTAVERPRLLKRLEESADKTILLCAPSGYGKSVLLEQWAAADPRRFHSILLGGQHDDPTALVDSIRKVFEPSDSLPADLGEGLTAPRPDVERVILPRLESAIASRREPFVLVLDELERIESPDSLAIVATLCRSAPPGSQVALATRIEPAIRLARMRANRGLVELRREDLTMTKGECTALVEGLDVALKPKQLDALVVRTEGWPAAIYLAGSALGESADLGRAVEQFAGDDRSLVDYIREEFLLPISKRRLDFLLRASVMERLSGPLCDWVLEREDSATVLRDLSRSNMLVIPLDRRDEWFRFHPLLREMLQSELRRAQPGREPELHVRASRWWQDRGEWDLAIKHAVDANAISRAGELLWEASPEYMTRGRNATMLAWLDRLGSAGVESSPGLSLTASWAQMTIGLGAEAEYSAARAKRLLAGEEPSEYKASLEAGLALLDATLARNGIAPMRAAIAPVRRMLPDDNPWHTLCCYLDGVGLHLTGEPAAARELLREGNRRGAVGAPNLQALCLAQLALLDADEGAWHEAELEMARARAQIKRAGLDEYPMIALAFAVSAFVRAERGAVEAAAADFAKALRRLDELDHWVPWYECEARIVLAGAAARLGNTPEARRLLDGASRLLAQLSEAPLLRRWAEKTEELLSRQTSTAADQLTVAEMRILQFLPSHLSFPQIAASVHVSPNTVKTHVRNIYGKFGVSSRREAIDHAERTGLLNRPAP